MRPWIALFSQTGQEIADIHRRTLYSPTWILTNSRPPEKRTISPLVYCIGTLVVELANRPTDEVLETFFSRYENPLITLHGWMRIMPPSLCDKYEIYNGHPGLITKYPELKGHNPQERAWSGQYSEIGSVIHRVTAGVDEGEILVYSGKVVDPKKLSLDDYYRILRQMSLDLWCSFIHEKLKEDV